MSEIDYALAYDFIDPTEPAVRYQLRFRPDTRHYGDPSQSNPTGQLVAEVIDPGGPDNGRTVPISRPGVHFNDVEVAVDRDNWPFLAPYKVDLAQIRARIRRAGLD